MLTVQREYRQEERIEMAGGVQRHARERTRISFTEARQSIATRDHVASQAVVHGEGEEIPVGGGKD